MCIWSLQWHWSHHMTRTWMDIQILLLCLGHFLIGFYTPRSSWTCRSSCHMLRRRRLQRSVGGKRKKNRKNTMNLTTHHQWPLTRPFHILRKKQKRTTWYLFINFLYVGLRIYNSNIRFYFDWWKNVNEDLQAGCRHSPQPASSHAGWSWSTNHVKLLINSQKV